MRNTRRRFTIAATALAASLALGTAMAGTQGYMIKIPISKLAELQGTSIEVTPTSAIFSSPTALGALAGPITVHVRNAGFSPITGIVPSITNGSSDFTLNNECPATLPGMGSCALTLNFKPTAVGERLGNLAVASSAKNGLQLVPISGTGMAPDATLTPGTFSATQIRETSTSTLVLANPSTAALRLTPAPLTGDFSLAGGSCGATLAAGASCNYAVDFKPTTAGAKTATFKVTLGVGSFSFDRTAALAGTAQAPAGTLSAVDFGAVPAGQGATRDATVTNTGAGPLTLGTPTAAGAGFSIATGGSCGATLAKGESCTVKVQLQPAGTSAHAGTLTVPVQDAAALTAGLAGQSQQALLGAISPAARAFGNVVVGQSATSPAHTLTNTGNIAATGLTYTAPGGFGITQGGCGSTLAAGASCQFTLSFSPTQGQAYAGNATIGSANAGTQLVALTGTGAQSVATLTSPATLALADWYQAGTITGAFSYRNDGNAAMTLTSPTLASPLSIASNSCTGVAPGSSCDITVALTRNAAAGGTGSQAFTAAGAGTAPAAATTSWSIYTVVPNWSSSTLSFGNVQAGQSSTKAITLTNNGSVAGNWAANPAINNLPAGFTADLSACGNVTPGGSCTVNFTFSPAAAQAYGGSGVAPAYASIVGNTLTLSGTGAAAAATLSDIAFGNVAAGSTSDLAATVTNTGVGPISVGAPSVTGAGFSITTGGTCGTTLAAGSSCTINVRYTASGIAAASGTLTLPTGAGAKTASLSGQSQQAQLVFAPTSLDFGSVQVGQSSTKPATLTNPGNIAATGLGGNLPAGFSVASVAPNPCGNTLAAGATCNLTLTFTPGAGQAYAGSFSVPSANAGTANLGLSGTGAQSKATLTSTATLTLADWYQSGSITGTYTYRNDGNTPMTLASPTLTSPLSVAGNSCTSVAAGSSCAITVALTRNASTGGSGAQAFTPTGAGTAPAQATMNWAIYSNVSSWSPSTLAFGSVAVGASVEKTTTLINSGSVAANWWGAFDLPAGFGVDSSACSNVVPGGSCVVKFTFTPTAAQAYSASAVSPRSASTTVNTLSLAGTGVMSDYSGLLSAYVNPTYQMSQLAPGWSTSVGGFYWANPAGYASAPYGPLNLGKQVDISGTTPVRAKLRFTADNWVANLVVNGSNIGLPSGGAYDAPTDSPIFTLLPGKNAITVQTVNAGDYSNPAGFVIEVLSESGSQLASAAGWKYSGAQQLVPLTGSPMQWVNKVGSSCKDYKNPAAGYAGATANGLYLVNMGGSTETVYCDMVTDGGGWTLVARSKPGASGAFGWFATRGAPTDFSQPYSMGILNKSMDFSQVLFGSGDGNSNTFGYSYKNNVTRAALDSHQDTPVWSGAIPVSAGASTGFGMAAYMGFTRVAANSYFFRDMDSAPDSYGIWAGGWNSAYGPGGSMDYYGGYINGAQGLLMVR
jgi:hypothetical protein